MTWPPEDLEHFLEFVPHAHVALPSRQDDVSFVIVPLTSKFTVTQGVCVPVHTTGHERTVGTHLPLGHFLAPVPQVQSAYVDLHLFASDGADQSTYTPVLGLKFSFLGHVILSAGQVAAQ
jgi:hypothetical protein